MRKEEGGRRKAEGRIILVGTELMSESRIAEGARALGYEVQAAGTIEAVVKAVASAPADVLILDLQAEGVPGRTVVELARRAGDSGLAVSLTAYEAEWQWSVTRLRSGGAANPR
jgi:DNA-binding response OmpR family regulator